MAEPRPFTMAAAIAAHQQAYNASVAASDAVYTMRLDYDPELRFEEEAEIASAMVARYGPEHTGYLRVFRGRVAEADATAEAEDAAWLAFRAMEPTTATELEAWVRYVVEHSSRMDEVVNLRDALAHLSGLLGKRFAA